MLLSFARRFCLLCALVACVATASAQELLIPPDQQSAAIELRQAFSDALDASPAQLVRLASPLEVAAATPDPAPRLREAIAEPLLQHDTGLPELPVSQVVVCELPAIEPATNVLAKATCDLSPTTPSLPEQTEPTLKRNFMTVFQADDLLQSLHQRVESGQRPPVPAVVADELGCFFTSGYMPVASPPRF